VTLSGTGEPDSAVEVVVDGQRAGQATVGSDGKWGLSVGLPEVKEYQVSVQAVDASGNVLAASEVVRLTVVAVTEEAALAEEGTAEAGSQVTAPTKEATAEVTAPTLNLPSGSVTPGKVELTGAGAPGSEVEVVVDGQVVGKTTVDRDGKWSISVELPEAKDYEVSVQGVDASGKVIAVSEATVIALVAPVATEEASASVIPPTLNLPTNAVTVGQVELTGTGEPGREVEVVVDGQVVGKTTVDSEGKWSLLVELPEAKEYRVSVQVLDVNGTVLAESETVSLEVSAEQVALPAIPTPTEAGGQPYTVQAGDWLSKLALKFYGDMFAYPIIFEATNLKAEEDSSFATLFDPDLIEIGQKLWIPDETE
jgi:nucleoid-associated protein YgaU